MGLDLVYFSGGAREHVLKKVIDSGHRVSRIYVNDPARWPKVNRTIEYANANGIDCQIVFKKSDLSKCHSFIENKICFSAGFFYLFDKSTIDKAQVILNVHGSLLPKYAGARTLSWVIVNGETESGVTVHKVDEFMDTGPILLQKAFPLSVFETTRSLARKTAAFEADVVVEALARYESLKDSAFKYQVNNGEKIYPNRVPTHSEIDPSKSLLDLFNEIRASDPELYPAHFFVDGQKVCIKFWRPDKPVDEIDLI